jgi:hypothetical protein
MFVKAFPDNLAAAFRKRFGSFRTAEGQARVR